MFLPILAALCGTSPSPANQQPVPTASCLVMYPLPDAELVQDAMREADAWARSPLVYLAVVADLGHGTESHRSYRLMPTLVLKGTRPPPQLSVPALPSRSELCVLYYGLNVEDGAELGSEFVIYASDDRPTQPSQLYIVSTRQLQDPTTLAAITRGRPEHRDDNPTADR